MTWRGACIAICLCGAVALAACSIGSGTGDSGKKDRTGYRPADRAFSLPVQPSHVLCRDNRLYVASFHDGKLLVLDERTGEVLRQFDSFDLHESPPIDGKSESRRCPPDALAMAGNRLFVGQAFGEAILVLDAASLQAIGRVKVGDSNGALTSEPGGRRVFFASNSEKAFYMIDVQTLATRRIGYPEGGFGIGCASVSPDGKSLYLGIQRGAREAGAAAPGAKVGPANPLRQTYSGPLLAVYDLSEDKYVALTSIGDTLEERGDDSSVPEAMAFDNRGMLYIAMGQCMAGVHVYDTARHQLGEPITFASRHRSFPWPGCSGIAVRGGKLFVTVGSNRELAIVDIKTRRCETVVPLGGTDDDHPGEIAQSERRLFVSNGALRRIFVLDGDGQ